MYFPHSITQVSRADLCTMSIAIRDRQADSCWQLCLFLSCCLWSDWSLMHSMPATHSIGNYLTPLGAQHTRRYTHTHNRAQAQQATKVEHNLRLSCCNPCSISTGRVLSSALWLLLSINHGHAFPMSHQDRSVQFLGNPVYLRQCHRWLHPDISLVSGAGEAQ